MPARLIITAASVICALSAAFAAAPERSSLNFGDTVRTYSMYLPDTLEKNAPLCIYLHGYGSNSRWREDLNAAADRHGYAVCYPDGAPDSKGKDGWNVGYPPQYNMPDNDIALMKALIKDVCTKYVLDTANVFCTGHSNGGDLIYKIIYTEPDIFNAYASVAGLTFSNVYLEKSISAPVPFMEIHGTADKVSMWNGDPGNTGGWGAYTSVPAAVGAVATANRCQSYALENVTTKSDATHTVTRHTYSDSPSGCDVVLYEVADGAHTWHDKDIDTGEIILSFFDRYRKTE